MEAGVSPALCLSNREIDERIGVSTQPLQNILWEGISVGLGKDHKH